MNLTNKYLEAYLAWKQAELVMIEAKIEVALETVYSKSDAGEQIELIKESVLRYKEVQRDVELTKKDMIVHPFNVNEVPIGCRVKEVREALVGVTISRENLTKEQEAELLGYDEKTKGWSNEPTRGIRNKERVEANGETK